MTYTVSFEADVLPSDLPANAKVERTSVLPLTLTPLGDREIRLSRSGKLEIRNRLRGNFDDPGYRFAYPNKDDARKLIEGLQEYVGDLPPVELPTAAARGAVELPLTFQTGRNRRVEVEKRVIAVGARIQITNTSYTGETVAALLDEDETRKVRDALTEALGDAPAPAKTTFTRDDAEPGVEVKAVRDRDGDTWYRKAQPHDAYRYPNGIWSMSKDAEKGDADWIHVRSYAPLVSV